MTTAADVLKIARLAIGEYEHPAGSNRTVFGKWYGMDGVAWCAMFVSYVFFHARLPLPASTSKGFAYTPSGAAWFQKQGRWQSSQSNDVKPGDVVFFYWPNMGRIAHVGIVEEARADGTLVTIEGNTDAAGGREGGEVMRRLRSRATVGRYGGFGRPAFQDNEEDELTKDEKDKLEFVYQAVSRKGPDGKPEGIDKWLDRKLAEILAEVKK